MSGQIDLKAIIRKETIISMVVNTVGALLAFIYFTVIDPVPTGMQSLRPLDSFASVAFVVILAGGFLIGESWGNRIKKVIRRWGSRIQSGEITPADVPNKIKRNVINFPLYGAGIAAVMWLMASSIAGYITSSSRVFFGLFGWGGSASVIWLYFVDDLMWRPVVAVFFPDGNLSEVGAFRLPIMMRLVMVFLFASISPTVMMVVLSWQREQLLLTSSNPQTILANLRLLQIFLLGANITASVGVAFLITRGITQPLDTLRSAMERVQEGELETRVVVTSNDELGYLGERFNQMTAELRQKEQVLDANVQLREQLAKIRELETALRDQAIRDPLTGLFNRRYMEEVLEQELAKAARRSKPLSVVIMDIDYLKEINDQYGHLTGGDNALLAISQKISELCRKEDTFCRYAGDEFLMVLYDTPLEIAYQRALEWKQAVADLTITTGNKDFGITISAGIAAFPAHGQTVEELVQHADHALYAAKDAGRNCVRIYQAESS